MIFAVGNFSLYIDLLQNKILCKHILDISIDLAH